MSHFYVHDGQYLLRSGYAPDGQEALQCAPDEKLVLGTVTTGPLPFPGARFDVHRREWVDCRTDAERRRDLMDQTLSSRRAEYPSIGDQLDMLWHAMKDGAMPKVEPFYSQIAEVKNKYPKQANNS